MTNFTPFFECYQRKEKQKKTTVISSGDLVGDSASRGFFWDFSFILFANLFKVRSVEWILDLWNERSLNLLGGQTFPVKSLEPAMFSDITNTSLLIANSFRIGLQTTPHAPTEAPAAPVAASELKSFGFNSRTHCRAISLTC